VAPIGDLEPPFGPLGNRCPVVHWNLLFPLAEVRLRTVHELEKRKCFSLRPTLKDSVWQLGAYRLFVTSVGFCLDPGDRLLRFLLMAKIVAI